MSIDYLLQNKDNNFSSSSVISVDAAMLTSISDKDFTDFLNTTNGGFFFDKSLHIYGICELPNTHSISFINNFIKQELGAMADGKYFFACDVFGNQFAFTTNGIELFTIETGQSEVIASNFAKWLDIIQENETEYTGHNLLTDWEKDNYRVLDYHQRLVPKTPFVIGGEYSTPNTYALDFFKVISYNANIAKQIYDLPDGTPIEVNVTE